MIDSMFPTNKLEIDSQSVFFFIVSINVLLVPCVEFNHADM